MITFVLVTRNDNHEGNSLQRLRNMLEVNCQRLKEAFPHLYQHFEILVGDWGSETPLSFDVLGMDPISIVKFVHFPKEVTSLFDTDFNEVHSLNYLIRNATNSIVARLDQDIIIGNVFFNYLRRQTYDHLRNNILWSPRTEMMQDFNIERYLLSKYSSTYFMDAIGIIMAPRLHWSCVKGYNEKLIYRNHMEHDLYKRFVEQFGNSYVVNIGDELCNPFFHQWHERTATETRKNNDPDNSPFANDENWGLQLYKHLITKTE